MSGAAVYRAAEEALVFPDDEEDFEVAKSQPAVMSNKCVQNQASVASTGSRSLRMSLRSSTGSRQDSVQDVEINPTVSPHWSLSVVQLESRNLTPHAFKAFAGVNVSDHLPEI